jgi:hypothetical protein
VAVFLQGQAQKYPGACSAEVFLGALLKLSLIPITGGGISFLKILPGVPNLHPVLGTVALEVRTLGRKAGFTSPLL